MQEHSLKKRYSTKLFSNIFNAIIGAVLVAIVPKALGPISYGHFVYLQDFFSKTISFLDMGTSIAFFTKLSANNQRKVLISFYAVYAFFILLVLLLFATIIKTFGYTEMVLPHIPNEYIFLGVFFSFFMWLTQIFIKISDAYALTVSVELIKIGNKAASLILLFYIIHFTAFDLDKYYTFQYISLVSFIVVLSWLFAKKNILTGYSLSALSSQFFDLVEEFILYCHPLIVSNVVGLAAGFFDIWLLQKISGSTQTGFYGLAYSLAAMCFMFTSAMTPIITREFAKSYEKKNIEQMKKLFYRYVPMLYAIAAYFGVFVSMQSKNIIQIFTDDKFKHAYLVLVVMGFYPIHQTYGQLVGSVFYATGKTRIYSNLTIVSMLLGSILTSVFVYFMEMGAVGLAYKMIIGQIFGVNLLLFYIAKFLSFDIKHFIAHQLYTVLSFTLIAYTSSNIVSLGSPVSDFLISGIIYTSFIIIYIYMYPKILGSSRDELQIYYKRLCNVIKK